MKSFDFSQLFMYDMLISYTKKHSINLEWIDANPKFTELITSGDLPLSNIESLFEASAKNTSFQQQFEQFLRNCFEQNHLLFTEEAAVI
jgi:hypothetical protein